jgi:hypothetical protein
MSRRLYPIGKYAINYIVGEVLMFVYNSEQRGM